MFAPWAVCTHSPSDNKGLVGTQPKGNKHRIRTADDVPVTTGTHSLFTAQVHAFRRIAVGGYIDKFAFVGVNYEGNTRFFAQCFPVVRSVLYEHSVLKIFRPPDGRPR